MRSSVVVIGGGWAGLAAALRLSDEGHSVRLLEASRRFGGRARSVSLGNLSVDIGQHLLLGSCRAVLALMQGVGVRESDAFLRLPFSLYMRDLNGRRVQFRAPRLPAPWHLGAALGGCRGLPLGARMRAAWRARALLASDPGALAGHTVTQWLSTTLQPRILREWFWEPLCLAALNTPPAEASACLMAALLREVMGDGRGSSDLLLPRENLDAIYVDPVVRRLQALGVAMELGAAALAIEVRSGRVHAVHTQGRSIKCDHVILATGPVSARTLLDSAGSREAAARIAELREESIATVYLRYPGQVRLEAPFVGVVGSQTQWLFDRSLCGQQGVIAAVISAERSPRHHAASKLGEKTAKELEVLYPQWRKPVEVRTVRERRATFSATPASDGVRRSIRTNLEGLWVAGDYTDTGLPGTLEGAVRSALRCAGAILSPPPQP